MENFDSKESSGQSLQDIGSEEKSDNISNYSKEDFTARYGSVSYSFEDEWMSGLELYDDEPRIFSLEPSSNISDHHQVYTILEETSEEFVADNNPVINPPNLRRGAKHVGEGETKATIATKEKN
jgi:hypothetical protein